MDTCDREDDHRLRRASGEGTGCVLTETDASAPVARLALILTRAPAVDRAGVAFHLSSICVDIRARVRKSDVKPVHDVDLLHSANARHKTERLDRRVDDVINDVQGANERAEGEDRRDQCRNTIQVILALKHIEVTPNFDVGVLSQVLFPLPLCPWVHFDLSGAGLFFAPPARARPHWIQALAILLNFQLYVIGRGLLEDPRHDAGGCGGDAASVRFSRRARG